MKKDVQHVVYVLSFCCVLHGVYGYITFQERHITMV